LEHLWDPAAKGEGVLGKGGRTEIIPPEIILKKNGKKFANKSAVVEGA